MFTQSQIHQLFEVIDFFHSFFIIENVGVSVLSDEDKRILKKNGVRLDKYQTGDNDLDLSFKFGILAQALGDNRSKSLTFDQFKQFLASGKFKPLTALEEAMLTSVKQQSYSDIKGLGNKISKDFSNIVIEANQKQRVKYETIIRDEAQNAVLNKLSVKELAIQLGKKTNDWSRDFGRISDYIMHKAFSEGNVAGMIQANHGDIKGIIVYFDVFDGACKQCQSLFLHGGQLGGAPIEFTLEEILNNGSNIGRKQVDWKPTVPPIHPWCRCQIVAKPKNMQWDNDKRRYVVVRNTYGVERKSKVKITLNNKQI